MATANTDPKIGPMHGLQPKAKATPIKDIAPPIHVPNKKPLIIDNKEANGKLHKINKLYKVKNINIDKKQFLDMKF